jgi:formylglycine-generating enzyme required for sulfatase activity
MPQKSFIIDQNPKPSPRPGECLLWFWVIPLGVFLLLLLIGVGVALVYNSPDKAATPIPTPPPSSAAPTPFIDGATLALMPVEANADWTPVIREVEGIEMVLVPAGSFIPGEIPASTEDRQLRQVKIETPFWIDRYEVSNAAYNRYLLALHGDSTTEPICQSRWCEDERPRDSISWEEALAYCQWRGGRLPSGIEWEYAGRGVDNWLYPWGNEFDPARVNYRGHYRQAGEGSLNPETMPIDSLPEGASWVGAYHLLGNVQEWIADGSQTSISRPHALRGGAAFNSELTLLREDFVGGADIADYNGFRCVLD